MSITDLINIAKTSYGHKYWKFGQYSLEDEIVFNDVAISSEELEKLYRNSNLISNIINYFPVAAYHSGYLVLDDNGEKVEDCSKWVCKVFKEASIISRLKGKSFLVINPETNESINSKFEDNTYNIYEKLIRVPNGWINTRHKIISYEQNQKKVEIVEKFYPESNVFIFFGKRTYLPDVDIDEDNYSDSVIKGLFTEYRNFIISNEFSRKILQNLSNMIISVKGLSLQLKNREMQEKIHYRLSLLDQNKSTSSAIAIDENESIDYIKQSLDNVTNFVESLKNILIGYTDIPKEKLFGWDQGSGYYTHIIVRQQWAEDIQLWIANNWLDNIDKIYNTAGVKFNKIAFQTNIILTEIEKAELEKTAAERNKLLIESGVIKPSEARTNYKGPEFSLNIALEDYCSGGTETISDIIPVSAPPEQ